MFITPQSHVFSSLNSLILSKNDDRRDKISIKSQLSTYLFSLFHLFQTALFLSFFRTKYASKPASNNIITAHFLTTKNTKESKNTVPPKIFHARPSHSLFSIYRTPIFVFSGNFTVDFFCVVYKNRKIILKERTATTQRCINPHNFCMKGLYVAKTG